MASDPRAPSTKGLWRRLAWRLCLSVAAVLLALALCEVALRLLHPKYRDVAEGQFPPDVLRIYAPAPNSRNWWPHPDTQRRHPFHHNNLGLRQHRDFDDADIASTTTVGVFGDSFVEMRWLDAPYVFTEPLDYLLNLDGRFSVLNFGVAGYGPAQSYFTYRSFRARGDLDYVLFAYNAKNDLSGLQQNRLFDLDDVGRLRQREMRERVWWVPFASRLHLTYLALDATGRLEPHAAGLTTRLHAALAANDLSRPVRLPTPITDYGLEVFNRLMRRWRSEVEENGGKFFVVLLPTQPDFPAERPLLEEAGVAVVDLNVCFQTRDEGHRGRRWLDSPYRFEHDRHWNELGNRLTAACLDERLRREAGLPAVSKAARDAALAEYYAAFQEPSAGVREGKPLASKEPSAGERIRRKYQAFGGLDAADATSSRGRLVFQSNHHDVYLAPDLFHGPSQLLFTKDDCDAGATMLPFAHLTPMDAGTLRPGYSYRRGAWYRRFETVEEGKCLMTQELPRWPISHILVGQRKANRLDKPLQGPLLWSGEIVLDREAFEKTLADMLSAAGEPVIESNMDVYVDGRRIFYVSETCQRTDGRTPFLLHITPTHEADLPHDRTEHGYVNIDFHQAGVTADGRCIVRWQLPDYPIRHIRTGQYIKVADGGNNILQRLWEGEAAIGG